MPRTTETISPIDLLYPDTDTCSQALSEFPTEDIFNKNIQALSKVNSNLTQIIDTTQLPDSFKLAITADGNYSYKVFDDLQISHWIGNRSTPELSAKADLSRQHIELTNATINSFSDGFTIKAILETLYPFQALFVLDSNPVKIKAALSIHDLSYYIESGQLVIIHGENVFETIKDFLIENIGYQLIEKSLYRYEFSEQQNKVFTSEVTAAVEKAYNNLADTLENSYKQLGSIQSKKVDLENLTNITIINTPDFLNPKASLISRDILNGFTANGLKTHHNFFDSPRYASTFTQALKYVDQKPDAVLMINNTRGTSIYKFPETTPIISVLSEISEDSVKTLATSATLANDIIACEAKYIDLIPESLKANLIEFPVCVNTDIYKPIAPDEFDIAAAQLKNVQKHNVVIITERTPISPEAYNIKLNSQIDLLSAACAAIVKDPAGYNKSLNKMYLDNAQKKSGVKITDDKLKSALLNIFAEIAKAVVIDTYGLAMIKAGLDIAVYSYDHHSSDGYNAIETPDDIPVYWEHSPLAKLVKGRVCDSDKLNIINNSGKIFVYMHTDGRLDHNMVNTIASGGFVLTKAHPRDNKPDGLKSLFTPSKDIITYTSQSDLCRKIDYYLSNEEKRMEIAENARQKLLQNRTIKQYCMKLLEKLAN